MTTLNLLSSITCCYNFCELTTATIDTYPITGTLKTISCDRQLAALWDISHLQLPYHTLAVHTTNELYLVEATTHQIMKPWQQRIKKLEKLIQATSNQTIKTGGKIPQTLGHYSFLNFHSYHSNHNWLALHHLTDILTIHGQTALQIGAHLQLLTTTREKYFRERIRLTETQCQYQYAIFSELFTYFEPLVTSSLPTSNAELTTQLPPLTQFFYFCDCCIYKYLTHIPTEDIISDKMLHFMRRIKRKRA